ncbi:hypothetical protein V8V91_02410 [Algoriphagus halophilus]|uniref:hypothetical protein n=1 Tax=Algoriphagus halophilus TaxID=226505 RepID=UPI00358DF6A0
MENVFSEKQRLFLRYAFIERKRYDEVALLIQLPRNEFKGWWEDLKEERERLKPIRDLWIKKCGDISYDEFEAAYLNTIPQCHYCGITTEQIELLWQKDPELTKRGRGRKLELERLAPNEEYSNLSNLVFSCYWCNNAKTDTFTEEEFMKVGEVIKGIWEERLEKL